MYIYIYHSTGFAEMKKLQNADYQQKVNDFEHKHQTATYKLAELHESYLQVCMCCSVLRVAACCSVLQCANIRPPPINSLNSMNLTFKCVCVAVCCSVLQRVAVRNHYY